MLDPKEYIVGWICAIATEYVAAQAFLDEKHAGPAFVSPNDNNVYTVGRVGKHNVAIAVLPDGEYGLAAAAGVARDMVHTFPNIRIGLMVGVGGGAPSRRHDIRLGDIVVSAPRDGKGGLFQYDFGKTIQDRNFQTTGFLNQPPALLRGAVGDIRAQYELDGHHLEEAINSILEKKPKLRKKYKRPDPNSDKLYRSDVVHPSDSGAGCAEVCGHDLSKLVSRPERTEEDDNPAIHYGLIASANQLMKDALIRDQLAAEKDVLCFEMEAAGLMNQFPCLVIRGVCDYSDSHKNKEWQGYAAMAAAAYAKDLLCRIPPNRMEAESRISDILTNLKAVAEAHRDIAQKQLEIQEAVVKQTLSDRQQKCLQMFRLTTDSKDATYEWYKERIEDRLDGTCEWFLGHQNFQKSLDQDSGPLLVSADPGCGKSVLAKYLIDHHLPRSGIICYVFFKDQDQKTVRQALCALLHQLFSQKPSLIKHALEQADKDGQGMVRSTGSLWTILQGAVRDPQAGPVIIVLDALDECVESEFENLLRNIERQFRSNECGHANLKYLLTSRPYEQIVSQFHSLMDAFPYIRIPGEEASQSIGQEVSRVILHRVERLAREKRVSDTVKDHLATKLLGFSNRTSLWVYLIFDHLRREGFKQTIKGVDLAITALPKSINQAYEQILSKSNDDPMVRKGLSIVLGAARPLKLSEMNVAMAIDSKSRTSRDLDLEQEEHFKLNLRSWCGLFVSIHHGKIYFLHQTAREFLLADSLPPMTIPPELHWHRSITRQHAHAVLAELCLRYLNFFDSEIEETGRNTGIQVFLEYSARHCGYHFSRGGGINDAVLIEYAVKICDPESMTFQNWFLFWPKSYGWKAVQSTRRTVASHLGHAAVAEELRERGGDLEMKDKLGWVPLSWAVERGHETIVRLLLKHGARSELQGGHGLIPLSLAVVNGHDRVVQLLQEHGASLKFRSEDYRRGLLSMAELNKYGRVVQLLLDNTYRIGMGAEEKDRVESS